MTRRDITVHEVEPLEPPEYPLLWTAAGEPLMGRDTRKVIGFGKGKRENKAD